MYNAIALIPARYAAVRLPRKPLLLLDGIPLICRVYQAVKATGLFNKVMVATDNEEIYDTVRKAGGEAAMTPLHCVSGTDRIVTIARESDYEIVVNVQGDEPFIGYKELKDLLDVFKSPQVEIASLMNRCQPDNCKNNPNVVKVVTDNRGYALYFSRSMIPYDRDGDAGYPVYKHIGVYAFRRDVLLRFPGMEQGVLERVEKLEQLRWLENGYRIMMVETDYAGIGIDTPEDLQQAEDIIRKWVHDS